MKQDELMKAFDIFKIQGFKTPEEMFVIGYLMAHGGEIHILGIIEHDIELLEETKNPDFWLPHIKDEHNIHIKACNDDIEVAKSVLRTLLNARNAEIPDWLEK